ncbi:MAG: hypothetical protein AB7I50_15760, partial [Vicinamibacterales bacterium]
VAAMTEIWSSAGFDGVAHLLADSEAPHVVGHFAALVMPADDTRVVFVHACLAGEVTTPDKFNGCLQGFLWALRGDRTAMLASAAEGLAPEALVRLFTCAPCSGDTWRQLAHYSEAIRAAYWKIVTPSWHRLDEAEIIELIDRLLEAERPRAAFRAVHLDWDKVETTRLKRLMLAVPTLAGDAPGTYQLDRHDISKALSSLDGRPGVSPAEMAQLEFLFLSALDHSEHGIPNLERQIEESPSLYVQVLAMGFKRSDEGTDPPEWRIDDPDRRESAAVAAHRLLSQIRRVPGTGPDGVISADALLSWAREVRQLCSQHGRVVIGDIHLGQLLARAPASDGAWPCRPVCEALEALASQEIREGFVIAVRNSRGVHHRGEGGDQERGLAARYRGWAQQLSSEFPYVSSLLEDVAASYDREAERHDSDAKVRRRLRHWV